MEDAKIVHLRLTIFSRHMHVMIWLLDPLLTYLDLKTTNWSLFLMASCALPHRPHLLNGLGFALFHHLRVINSSKCTRKASQEDRGPVTVVP